MKVSDRWIWGEFATESSTAIEVQRPLGLAANRFKRDPALFLLSFETLPFAVLLRQYRTSERRISYTLSSEVDVCLNH